MREHELRVGSSSKSVRRRAPTGLTIFRATERKPEWHMLPGSSCTYVSSITIWKRTQRRGMILDSPCVELRIQLLLHIRARSHHHKNTTYQKIIRRCRSRVEIDGPIHKSLAPSYRKDDNVHVVDWDRLDDHCLCAHAPVSVDVRFAFFACGF